LLAIDLALPLFLSLSVSLSLSLVAFTCDRELHVYRSRSAGDVLSTICKWNKGIFGKSRRGGRTSGRGRAFRRAVAFSIEMRIIKRGGGGGGKEDKEKRTQAHAQKTKNETTERDRSKTKSKIKRKEKKEGNAEGESDCARIYVPADPA